MRLLPIFVLFLLIFSCIAEKSTPEYVVLSGELKGLSADSLTMETDERFRYFQQEKLLLHIPITANSTFRDTVVLEEGHYQLRVGNEIISLFLKPGYNLQLQLTEGNAQFNGTGSAESNYLKERDSLIKIVGGKNFYQYYSHLPEEDFLKSAESLEKQRLDLIKSHSNIDSQLYKSETLWAKVEKAHKIHNYSFTRETVDTTYKASSRYPEPFTHLDLNDEDLLNVSLLPILMYSEFGQTAMAKRLEVWEYVFEEDFPVSNQLIKEEALFAIGKYAMNRFKKLDDFYLASQNFFQNKEYKEEITKKYLDLKNLAPGKPAPGFELQTMEGEVVNLKDYSGNLVYLDFWSTSCRPCIEEMPAFNKLQEAFKDEKIRFISIGINSRREGLVRIIQKHQFKGIHVYDPSQEEEVVRKYAVTGIPRYVLIDKEGKIIEHLANRPSHPHLVGQLTQLLKN